MGKARPRETVALHSGMLMTPTPDPSTHIPTHEGGESQRTFFEVSSPGCEPLRFSSGLFPRQVRQRLSESRESIHTIKRPDHSNCRLMVYGCTGVLPRHIEIGPTKYADRKVVSAVVFESRVSFKCFCRIVLRFASSLIFICLSLGF